MKNRPFFLTVVAVLTLAGCGNREKYEITAQDEAFMREAIRLASESVAGGGGPFGAVIVKDEALESFRLWSEKNDKTEY